MKKKAIQFLAVGCVLFFTYSCKKEKEQQTFPDNNAPYYDGIPKLLVDNYVNRVYIDLLGREPLDVEMEDEVDRLRSNSLSAESRDSMIIKLQTDETFVIGDSSYKTAYYQRFYDLSKAKMIEGASDAYISQQKGMLKFRILNDSLEGNFLQLEIHREMLKRINDVLHIRKDFENNSIEINEVFARLLNNDVYDEINMNTFNFVRASFNDLYLRFPTDAEFLKGFNMIEYNNSEQLFGISGKSKSDFIEIIVNSQEFYEGIIRWQYQNLLSREPDTKEVFELLEDFMLTKDVKLVQRKILITDEYANFD